MKLTPREMVEIAASYVPVTADEIGNYCSRLMYLKRKNRDVEWTIEQIVAISAALTIAFVNGPKTFDHLKEAAEQREFWHLLRTADWVQQAAKADKFEIIVEHFTFDQANIMRLIGEEFEAILNIHDYLTGHKPVREANDG